MRRVWRVSGGAQGVLWALVALAASFSLTGCGDAGAAGAPPRGRPAPESAQGNTDAFVAADSGRILQDLQALAHDSMEGRRMGTPGSARARALIRAAMEEAGLQPAFGPGGWAPAVPGEEGWIQPFEARNRRDTTQVMRGANVVGVVPGREPNGRVIVLTAHYDHLGVRTPRGGSPEEATGDSIFNGADDNASGTVAILEVARYVARNPLRHTVVFAALDGEEAGIQGARAFAAASWPDTLALNVNLDMVSRSDSLLFAAGTSHYPWLLPILEGVRARPPVVLAFGHDRPAVPGVDDWTGSSDHRAFHAMGVPFVYFGVEDHQDYHHAGDEFEKVDPAFFLNSIRTILAAVLALDEQMEGARASAGNGEAGDVAADASTTGG